MQKCFIKEIGQHTKNLGRMIMIVLLLRVIIGKVRNSALNHGSAEAQECAKEADGALGLMDVKGLLCRLRLQDFRIRIEDY